MFSLFIVLLTFSKFLAKKYLFLNDEHALLELLLLPLHFNSDW